MPPSVRVVLGVADGSGAEETRDRGLDPPDARTEHPRVTGVGCGGVVGPLTPDGAQRAAHQISYVNGPGVRKSVSADKISLQWLRR